MFRHLIFKTKLVKQSTEFARYCALVQTLSNHKIFTDSLQQTFFILQTVPHGVLCFLPSYSMLDKLMKRWKVIYSKRQGSFTKHCATIVILSFQMTGLWGRLNRLKNTFSEPRRGDKTGENLR